MGARLGPGPRRTALFQLGTRALVLRPSQATDMGARSFEQPLESSSVAAACAALRAVLAGHDKTAIDVHLSCGWSRLLLLPWMDQLTGEDRWSNYAHARFEQVYGESSEAWEVHLARDVPGQDRIAVAWPRALREALGAHANVRSVRVALLEHLGVLLAHEPDFSGCLIEIESDRAGFVLLLNGLPRRIRWCRFDNDEGLRSAVRTEWANVLAAEARAPGSVQGLALTPPAPQPGSARAATIGVLAIGLGFTRAFSLPEWP